MIKRGYQLTVMMLLANLLACGGGNDNPHTVIPSYDIGGKVSNLNGNVVLQINGQTELTLSSNGAFTFPNSLKSNRDYNVTVLYQPITSSCIVRNGRGVVKDADISNINVSCEHPAIPLNISVDTPTASDQPKQLEFNWDTVTTSTHYKLYENADGKSGFSQLSSDLTTTSLTKQISVHKHDWPNARYLIQACDTQSCSESSNQMSTIGLDEEAIGYFKASNTQTGAQFGASVALSADSTTLAVGSPYESSNGIAAGAVYIFHFDGSRWQQQELIRAINTGEGDQFGYSLAISDDGNTLAIGAPGESSDSNTINGTDNNNAVFSGAAYIFTRNNTTWTQQAYIKPSNTDTGDRFGSSITLSGSDGNTLAVGAIYESSNAAAVYEPTDIIAQANNSSSWSGASYVFIRNNNQWNQQAYIKAPNSDSQDLFGHAVALNSDGRSLAVSAIYEASSTASDQFNNSANGAGAVYIYNLTTVWTLNAYLKAEQPDIDDNFGYALDFNAQGDRLAVGAPRESSNSTGINGNQLNNSAQSSGAAYLFRLANPSWRQTRYIKATNTNTGDRFGFSVALNAAGDELAVGAISESSSGTGVNSNQNNNSSDAAGAVYYFDETDKWRQQQYIKAINTGTGDQFGYAIDLDASGDTLVISARRESSDITGVSSNLPENNSAIESGAVYIY